MDLDPYVAHVTDQLTSTAALGDERTREIAAALATSASGAVRLASISAISATIDEVNRAVAESAGGFTFSVQFENDEPVINVQRAATQPADDLDDRDGGEASARISLRLSEALKAEIDTAAAAAAVSVNTWLVRAARAGLNRGNGQPTTRTGHHIRGWVTG